MMRSALLVLGLSTAVAYDMSLSPSTDIYEGQEIRLVLEAPTGKTFSAANNELEVRVYKKPTVAATCTAIAAANTASLWAGTMWGKPDAAKDNLAAMTFVAPPAATGAFIICFKHASNANAWTEFKVGTAAEWTPQALAFTVTFPHATVGQNAVGVVKSQGIALHGSSSSCYTDDKKTSCTGDMFKFVRKGAPCTPEANTPDDYFGTNKIAAADGLWANDGGSDITKSFYSNNIGLGAIGTNTANPLVDTTDGGEIGATVYVYATIPSEAYDVCYSSKLIRAAAKTAAVRDSIVTPLWLKIKGCNNMACKDDTTKYTWSFTPVAETMKWTTPDLTPKSYGTIVFEDATGDLNTNMHTGSDYYTPTGGDMFKIVSEDKFTSKFAPGCWDTTNNDMDLTLMPYGSKNLHGDPTHNGANNNANKQQVAFGDVWVPATGNWYVCYRTTEKMTGFRVVPYSSDPATATARRFALFTGYQEAMKLVPGVYSRSQGIYTPTSVWSQVDKRATTYGALVIQKQQVLAERSAATTSVSVSGSYDARKSSYWSAEPMTANLGTTVGSAAILVPKGKSCFETTGILGSVDGGMQECMTGMATSDTTNCMGSASNAASLAQVAFYITVPTSGTYSVCFRHHANNWMMLATDYVVTTAPTLSLEHEFSDFTEQMESFFSVKDTSGKGLTTGEWKDVFRLVPEGRTCDLNPDNYAANQMSAYLSVYCKNDGAYGVLDVDCRSASTTHDYLCRGVNCNTDTVTRAWLGANLKDENPTNDVVPFKYDATVERVAAYVQIPKYNFGANNKWQVCYRQSKTNMNNWVILARMEVERSTVTVPGIQNVQAPLLGGSMQTFTFASTVTGNFEAKLVPYYTWGHCGNPAGGSDANPVESASSFSGTGTAFDLMVPQTTGQYMLCLKIRPKSWIRAEVFSVTDNGIRWYIKSGSEPYNGAAMRVYMRRGTCGASCDFESNHEMFNTDIGKDSAKVVPVGSDCSAAHVDLNGASYVNLGPGDGYADVAEAIVTLPPATGKVTYKVCAKAMFKQWGAMHSKWVQVAQASGATDQVVVREADRSTPEFVTMISDVSTFQILAGIRPSSTTYTYPLTETVIAGSSSTYIQGNVVAGGFRFNPTSGKVLSASHQFKLVQKSTYDGRWGGNFKEVAWEANCFNQSAETATNTVACTDGELAGTCPKLEKGSGQSYVSGVFQFPVDPAAYIVCYRTTTNHPWIQLKATTGATKLWAIPSMLEVESLSATALTIFDRSMTADYKDIPSWCSDTTSGANHGCGSAKDYVAVIQASRVCVPPTSAGATTANSWYPLKAQGNIRTVTVDTTGTSFSLPSAANSAYKICVYKNGMKQNLQKGLVYQLYNRGSMDGYYRTGVSVPSLLVSTNLKYDDQKRFVEWTTATEDTYNEVSTDILMVDGNLYRTPAIRTGEVIDFEVMIPGFANEVVTVEHCQVPSGWGDLSCVPVDSSSLMIRNVFATCDYKTSEWYGWTKGGLSQHAVGGRVQFRLQVLSACTSNNGFGCGIRFTSNGKSSAPQWFNVLPHYPDAVAINMNYVAPAVECQTSSIDCLMFTCREGTDCRVEIQARYGGPAEYSALGEVVASTIAEGSQLSNFVQALKAIPSMGWSTTGSTTLQLAAGDITLKNNVDSGIIRMRLTYGKPGQTTWTQFAIKVVRPKPASIKLVDLMPMDKHLTQGRTPAPAFIATDPSGPLAEMAGRQEAPGSTHGLIAASDSYIESLVPYELRYTIFDDSGKPLTKDDSMGDWKVTAQLTQSVGGREAATTESSTDGNMIMKVLMDGDVPSMMNMWTTDGSEVAFGQEVPIAKNNGWVQHFRLRNNRGCSRFNPCNIVFTWSKSGATSMMAVVRAPVRVVGSTTLVSTAGDTSVGTISSGITVTVEAGTPSEDFGWLTDEYHYGNAFALFEDYSFAEGTTSWGRALVAPDTGSTRTCMYTDSCPNSCKVYGYPFRAIGNTWAASWVLKTDRKCTNCKFTFHSDMGASPYAYNGKQSGFETYTFTGEPAIQCTADFNIACVKDAPKCRTFNLQLAITTPEAVTCDAPKWRVYLDSDIKELRTSGADYSLDYNFDSQMTTMGMDTTATFKDLAFMKDSNSPSLPTSSTHQNPSEKRTIKMHAMRYIYGMPGNQNYVATQNFSCDVTVGLYYEGPPAESEWTEITGVTGATAMCDQEDKCLNWYTTTDQLKSGLTIGTRYRKTVYSAGVLQEMEDTTENMNYAVIPLGGFNTVNKNTAFTVTTGGLSATLGSNRDTTSFQTDSKGNRWTWGLAKVLFAGGAHSTTGSLSMKYNTGATEQPASELVFSVCGKVGTTGRVLTSKCQTIKLWVLLQSPSLQLAITSESTDTQLRAATCAEEGVEAVSVTAMAYYKAAGITDRFFYAYTTPLQYSLTFSGQQFITGTNSPLASAVTRNNQVPTSNSLATRLQTATTRQSLEVSLTAYGASVASINSVNVAVTNLDTSTQDATANTARRYSFVKPTGTIKKWTLLETVAHANTCPNAEASFAYFNNYYRSYHQGVTPGKGWSYALGATVGVPFPMQTLVVDNNGNRAYTFESRKVRVSIVKPFVGCNDGKDIQVYSIKQPTGSATMLLKGDMASWESAAQNAVTGDRGLATPWVVINEPAERVVLQLDLCYGTSDIQECLTSPTSADSDAMPVFGDRSKFTKPFSVRPRKTTHLQVVSQDIPTNSNVQIGESMSVQLEAVSLHTEKQWTVLDANQRPDKIYVSSSYHSSSDGLKYGNGGFMKETTARSGCQVPLTGTDLAESRGYVPFDPASLELMFYFARPCASCGINVHYLMHDSLTTFPLRQWAQAGSFPSIGSPLVMRVTTCGTKWMLGGVPPVAVSSRKPFSVTALRVDNNNFPSWDSTEVVDITKLSGVGNGMGGLMWQTSPVAKAVDGRATARVLFTRPCFLCKLKFGADLRLTVLTYASIVNLVPTAHNMMQSKTMENSDMAASWDLDAYWSDSRGYRAFTNGPSQLTMKPRYMQNMNKLAKMNIGSYALQDYTNRVQGYSLITGSANVHLANATHMINGLPFQLGTLGRFSFRMTRPAIGYRVNLGKPTYYLGSSSGFSVDFTVPPTTMAVEKNTAVGCSTTYVNSACSFKAFAIGQIPNAESDTYYLSTVPVGGSATAEYSCPGSCATLSISVGSFNKGIAMISATATAVSATACSCSITVKPPASLASATDQVFEMEFNIKDPRPVTAWRATSSDIYSTNGMRSIRRHEVTIDLVPVAADEEQSDAALNSQVSVVTVKDSFMSPSGCFVCSNVVSDPVDNPVAHQAGVLTVANKQCTVDVSSSNVASLKGYFASTGTCTIRAGALSSLPITGSSTMVDVQEVYTFTVEETKRVRINEQQGVMGSKSWFAHLTALTNDGQGEADGMPAAVQSVGTSLIFTMIDTDGDHVLGDYHSTVSVDIMRNNAKVGDTLTAKAAGGVIRVPFNPPAPTHSGETHTPYTFAVTFSTNYVSGTTDVELAKWTLGPLYVVKTGSKLRTSISDAGANNWAVYTPEMHWINHRPFDLKVEMLDSDGGLVSHTGDHGDNAVATLQPLTIPCRNVDMTPGYLTSTCIEGIGTCMKEPEVPCVDGWRKGADDNAGIVQDRDVQMVGGVAVFEGLRWTEAEGIQGMYVHAEVREHYLSDVASLLHFDMQHPASLSLTALQATHEVSDVFTISGTILDRWADRVEAEDYTQFTITPVCEDAGADIFFQLKETNSTGHEVRVLVNRVTATAVDGVVSFGGLYFSNVCNVTKIAIAPRAYTPALPTTVKAMSAAFKVQNVNNVTIAKPSPFKPKLSLGLGTFSTKELALAFMKAVWISELVDEGFTRNMLNVMMRNVQAATGVKLLYLCYLPTTRAAGGITRTDRDGAATDGARCLSREQVLTANSASHRGSVLNDAFTCLAEFEVQMGADEDNVEDQLHDAIVADLASPSSSLKNSNPSTFQNANADLSILYTPEPTGALAPEFGGSSIVSPMNIGCLLLLLVSFLL